MVNTIPTSNTYKKYYLVQISNVLPTPEERPEIVTASTAEYLVILPELVSKLTYEPAVPAKAPIPIETVSVPPSVLVKLKEIVPAVPVEKYFLNSNKLPGKSYVAPVETRLPDVL